MNIHSIQGGGGVRLHVREWGNASGSSILFIHGWWQNHLCWSKQYESELASSYRRVALDLRGHGMYDAPREASAYQNPQLWADDIAAVITELSLDHPILVGWSYAGFIISDYLRAHGQDHISGVLFVGAVTTSGRFSGPGLLSVVADATAEDFPTNIRGMRQFLRNCTVKPLPPDDFEIALCCNIIVRPDVRGALGSRAIHSGDVVSTLRAPLLAALVRQHTYMMLSSR